MGAEGDEARTPVERSTPQTIRRTSNERRSEVIDEIFERAVPWGVFIGIGALIGAAFPRETRNAARTVMVGGFRAAEWARTFSAEAYEKGQDVFAEAASSTSS